jgi:hypothetical protein
VKNSKDEVLRYLGRRGQEVPEELNRLIDECITLIKEAASFRQVHLAFPITFCENGITLAGAELFLRGKDITHHLFNCGKAVLLATTLGSEVDALIHKWKHADITRSFVLDACATQLIEEYCESIQLQIWEEAAASGLTATWRFSPGYGDFSLDIQPHILETLNAGRRIGLTCTEHFILLPRKSITAIIGLGEKTDLHARGCSSCNLCNTCNFCEKDDVFDGY